MSWDVVGAVAKALVERLVGLEHAGALGVLVGGQEALSSPDTSSPTTLSHIARASQLIVDMSGEGDTVNARHKVGSLHTNITEVGASILPMEAVFWWQSNICRVLSTNRQTFSELAVCRNGVAVSEHSIADGAFRATIRPLDTVLRNRESVLNDPGGVCDNTCLQTQRNVRVRLTTVDYVGRNHRRQKGKNN